MSVFIPNVRLVKGVKTVLKPGDSYGEGTVIAIYGSSGGSLVFKENKLKPTPLYMSYYVCDSRTEESCRMCKHNAVDKCHAPLAAYSGAGKER